MSQGCWHGGELESFRHLCARVLRGVAKNTQEIIWADIGGLFAQVIEVDKEVKHKIFIYDVVPVIRLDIVKDSRAKTTVEGDNFIELRESRPRYVLFPACIGLVESLSRNKPW